MTESKISKGVGEVGHAVMVIVFFALVIGSILSISIFSNVDVTGDVANETIAGLDEVTNVTLASKALDADTSCSLTSLLNTTDGEVITATNYTFYADACNIILLAGSPYIANGGNVNVTYGYTYESNESSALGVDINALSAIFAAFVVAVTSFIVIGGTLLGILWILPYIRPLFRKDALGMSD